MSTILKLCAFSFLFSPMTFAQSRVEVSPFPGEFLSRMSDSVNNEWNDLGDKLSASLFESLTDRELVDFNLGGDLNLKLEVRRRVFNNQDILDTWTVIDSVRIPLHLPIPITSNEIGMGNGVFGVQLGLTLGANAFNIRQVGPANFDELEPTEKLEEELREAKKLADLLKNELPEDDILFESSQQEREGILGRAEDFILWNTENPRTRARYSKLLNILTHPFRLPLTSERIKEFPIGEISSYTLDGSIQLGASVGWNGIDLISENLTNSRAGLGLATYLEGKYRVSIWKEKANSAQVKVSRIRTKGVVATLGSSEARHEIFRGFIVFGHNILNISEQVVPFNLVVNKGQSEQFDIGYRYDLNSTQALKAYEKAAFGRFALSDELSEVPNSGVKKIYTRNQVSTSQNNQYKMKLSLFFERVRSSSTTQSAAIITLNGEETHLFKAVQNNYQGYDTLWGSAESSRYTFITTADRDRYNNGENAISLRIEGRIEDSKTNGKEIREYKNEVEAATGIKDLFPLPPLYEPMNQECLEYYDSRDIEENNCTHKYARYGRTSFFYYLGLERSHIEKFANYDEKKMWQAMEIAFNKKEGAWRSPLSRSFRFVLNSYATILNVPLALLDINIKNGGDLIIAKRFVKRWKELKDQKNPENLVKEMGKLFKTVNHSFSLIKLVRYTLKEEQLPYFVTASANRLFGQISRSGSNLADVDTITTRAERAIEFDSIGPRANYDAEAQVKKLEVKKINDETLEITFTLEKNARYIYFRVDKTPGWSRYQNLAKLIIRNNGVFTTGENKLIITKDENDEGFRKTLADAIFNGKQSTFMMSISRDGQKWGAVEQKKFRIGSDD
jgi:hypothetical protein